MQRAGNSLRSRAVCDRRLRTSAGMSRDRSAMSKNSDLITRVDHTGNTIVVTLSGQLNRVSEEDVGELLASALSTPDLAAVHVDLTGITSIDSTGLQSLVTAHQTALDYGLTFTLSVAENLAPTSTVL